MNNSLYQSSLYLFCIIGIGRDSKKVRGNISHYMKLSQMFKVESKMFRGVSRALIGEKSEYDREKFMAPSNYDHYGKLNNT